ncbi:MAG TPA: hypothetical protein PLZ92_09375 [Phycicoccus sp.]|jgi:hypothetical protein|nr:hypothetical protein [Phycicoccus sp.]
MGPDTTAPGSDAAPGGADAFIEQARRIGAEGGYRLEVTPKGFTWRHPHRPQWCMVTLDEGRHIFRITEAAPGFRGQTWSKDFAATIGLDGVNASTWAAVNPRSVIQLIGRELGWTERKPAAVLFAMVMAAVGAGGAVVAIIALLFGWLTGRF